MIYMIRYVLIAFGIGFFFGWFWRERKLREQIMDPKKFGELLRSLGLKKTKKGIKIEPEPFIELILKILIILLVCLMILMASGLI